jgi:hypothetical protein
MKGAIENLAKLERESRQLRRLEVLIDVVFAIVIWRAFMLIPRPGQGGWNWDSIALCSFASNAFQRECSGQRLEKKFHEACQI